VVQVDGYSIILYLDDHTIESATVLSLEGDDVAFVDVSRVKLSVTHEVCFRNVEHQLFVKLAIGFLAWDDEIELVAFLQGFKSFFEWFEYSAEFADEHERMFA
jgi:hypothetical protein